MKRRSIKRTINIKSQAKVRRSINIVTGRTEDRNQSQSQTPMSHTTEGIKEMHQKSLTTINTKRGERKEEMRGEKVDTGQGREVQAVIREKTIHTDQGMQTSKI